MSVASGSLGNTVDAVKVVKVKVFVQLPPTATPTPMMDPPVDPIF
jgi:hypothetical protein